MKSPKGFLIDLDGVMYTGNSPVPGAKDAIDFISKSGLPYRFLSNTTRKSRKTIAGRLAGMGLIIPEQYIFTPAVAASAYIRNSGKHKCWFLITGDADRDFDPSLEPTLDETVDCVVIGDAGEKITYDTLNTAFRHLMCGAGLIALERDRYWMAEDGLSLSAGPFVSALEFATGLKAVVIGKPSPEFFLLALKDMGILPEEAVMIGDDILTDIAGAQALGMKGVLVRTGKFQQNVVQSSGVRPDYTIDSIKDLPELCRT